MNEPRKMNEQLRQSKRGIKGRREERGWKKRERKAFLKLLWLILSKICQLILIFFHVRLDTNGLYTFSTTVS